VNSKKVILFDLGNTLVEYYPRRQWPLIVYETIAKARDYLFSKDLLNVTTETIWKNVEKERHDPPDYRVIPLAERLSRVFALGDIQDGVKNHLCRAFLTPIFARGRVYDDTLACLENLRSCGFKIGIVSNTPWCSGGDLWRQELKKLGLLNKVDEAVFCTDVGWRKPAHQIFDHTLAKFNAVVSDCVFIGDDPKWDIDGPRAIGMDAILLDRTGQNNHPDTAVIHNLNELMAYLQPYHEEGTKQ
jgi:putative hydrolase of the HAD superfamily